MGGAREPDEGASGVENKGEGLRRGSEIEVDGVSAVSFRVDLGFDWVGLAIFEVVGSCDGS